MRYLRVTVERIGRDPGDNEILDVAMIRMEGKPHDGVADYCAVFSEGGGQLPAAPARSAPLTGKTWGSGSCCRPP